MIAEQIKAYQQVANSRLLLRVLNALPDGDPVRLQVESALSAMAHDDVIDIDAAWALYSRLMDERRHCVPS
jgi:hypothetical protein